MANKNPHQPIHSWTAPEYQHYQKNPAWYITFCAVLILIVGFEIIQGDYFGGICLGILGGLAIYLSTYQPKDIDISISQKGIHLGELFIPHNKIKHFWIVDSPHHKTLNLSTNALMQNMVVVELADQDPEEIREKLAGLITEVEKDQPTLSQKVTKWLRF